MTIIGWLLLGLISGFVASKIVNKHGEGFLMDVILGIVPDDWLEERTPVSAAEARQAYRRYFLERLAAPRTFVAEVVGAR